MLGYVARSFKGYCKGLYIKKNKMYSLKPAPGKPGILNLHEGDNIKCCPFTIAVPSQDNYGRISLIQQPCGTQCAMFNLVRIDKSESKVFLNCSNDLSYTAQTNEAPPLNIIK